MDKQRIAKELVRLAKELVEAGTSIDEIDAPAKADLNMTAGEFNETLQMLPSGKDDKFVEAVFTMMRKEAKRQYGEVEMDWDDVPEPLEDNWLTIYVAHLALDDADSSSNRNKSLKSLVKAQGRDSIVRKYAR